MTKKTKKIIEWSLFSALAIIFLITSSLFFYQKAYAGKIYNNVLVNGVDLGGKTKKQAYFIFENAYSNTLSKEVTFSADDSNITIPVSETGFDLNVDKVIEEAYSVGRDKNFLIQLLTSSKTLVFKKNIKIPANIDKEKFQKLINDELPGLNKDPKDAQVVIESGQVKIIPEEAGLKIDTENVEDELVNLSLNNGGDATLQINLKSVVANPDVLAENLDNVKNLADSYISKKIELSYDGKTYSPSRDDIGKWLSFEKNDKKTYNIALSDTAIKAYLGAVAKNFEIERKDKKINALDNSVLEEGREGMYLDKNSALLSIKSQFLLENSFSIKLATYTEAPKEVKVFPAEGIVPGRYEGKYIDIDLSQQKLCIIESLNINGCFIISSGKPSMPTPTGTRYIDSKNPRAWSAKYGLYMPFWMSMGGGYGIHELPEWPGGYKEGENHLGTPVSHGCVRLGVGSAETVYNWTPVGTPVYIHK